VVVHEVAGLGTRTTSKPRGPEGNTESRDSGLHDASKSGDPGRLPVTVKFPQIKRYAYQNPAYRSAHRPLANLSGNVGSVRRVSPSSVPSVEMGRLAMA